LAELLEASLIDINDGDQAFRLDPRLDRLVDVEHANPENLDRQWIPNSQSQQGSQCE
jgi:hypothetical protein